MLERLIAVPRRNSGHRYWKLDITANNGNSLFCEFSEFVLKDSGSTNYVPANKTTMAFSSTQAGVTNSQNVLSDAVSNNNFAFAYGNKTGWITIDLGSAKAISKLEIWGDHTDNVNVNPKNFTLNWSDTSQTGPWTVALTVTNSTGWSTEEHRTWTF
jgi:hypothetical protein